MRIHNKLMSFIPVLLVILAPLTNIIINHYQENNLIIIPPNNALITHIKNQISQLLPQSEFKNVNFRLSQATVEYLGDTIIFSLKHDIDQQVFIVKKYKKQGNINNHYFFDLATNIPYATLKNN